MPQVKKLLSEYEKMRDIGRTCCTGGEQWVSVYKNAGGDQSLDVCFDSKTPNLVQYRLNVGFPVKLTNALAIASEVELSKHWNAFLVDTPQVLSRTGSTRMIV